MCRSGPVEDYLKENKEAGGNVMDDFVEITRLRIDIHEGKVFLKRFLKDVGWRVMCEIVRYGCGIMIDSGGGLGGVEVVGLYGWFKQGA